MSSGDELRKRLADRRRNRSGKTSLKRDALPWSVTPVFPVLKAIGSAIRGKRLTPEALQDVAADRGAIIPDHTVEVAHVSGKELNRRKGHYTITIDGPKLTGRWIFSSGDMEKAAQEATQADH